MRSPVEEAVDGPSNSILPATIVTALIVAVTIVFVACVVCKCCRREKRLKPIDDGDTETDSPKVRSKGSGRQRRKVT